MKETVWIEVSCPHCDSVFDVAEEIVGQTIECQVCKESFLVEVPQKDKEEPVLEKEPKQETKVPRKRTPYRWARLFIHGIWLVVGIVGISLLVFAYLSIAGYVVAVREKAKALQAEKLNLIKLQEEVTEHYEQTVATLNQEGDTPDLIIKINEGRLQVETEQNTDPKYKPAVGISIPQNLFTVTLEFDEELSDEELSKMLEENTRLLNNAVASVKEIYRARLMTALENRFQSLQRRFAPNESVPRIAPVVETEKRSGGILKRNTKTVFLYNEEQRAQDAISSMFDSINFYLQSKNDNMDLNRELGDFILWCEYILKNFFVRDSGAFVPIVGEGIAVVKPPVMNNPTPQKQEEKRIPFNLQALEQLMKRLANALNTTMAWKIDQDVSRYENASGQLMRDMADYASFKSPKRKEMAKELLRYGGYHLAAAFVLLVLADFLRAFLDMATTIVERRGEA